MSDEPFDLDGTLSVWCREAVERIKAGADPDATLGDLKTSANTLYTIANRRSAS